MFLADLLNSRGLFQRISRWMSEPEFSDELSLLLNRGTSAVVGIHRINEAESMCIREFELFEDQIDDADDRIVFNSQTLVALQNEVSPLLSTLRIMQDMLLPLIGKKLKKSVPGSINDAIKKIDAYGLPQEICELLSQYWSEGGSRIRDYRILDQHYTGLVDFIFLQIRPRKQVLLLFPDNPKEHSKKKLKYENEIDGLHLLKCGFNDLHSLVDSFAGYLGYEPEKINTVIGMNQLGELRPFRKRTLAFLYETTLKRNERERLEMNVSGINFRQLDTGQLSMQKMLLTESKLRELRQMVQRISG